MKKRFLAFMMATVMVLGSTTVVLAEEETEAVETAAAEVPEINWEDVAAQIDGNESWAGDFMTFDEIALKMYVPSTFEAVELADEDREAGYIAYLAIGEDAAVGVQYVDMDEMELADYATLLTDSYGVTDVTPMIVNGIEMISYTNPDDESVGVVALATEMGYIMEFSFAPITDEGFQAVASVMTASIQVAE